MPQKKHAQILESELNKCVDELTALGVTCPRPVCCVASGRAVSGANDAEESTEELVVSAVNICSNSTRMRSPVIVL